LASAASAQVERTLHVTGPSDPRFLPQIATTLRTVADIRNVSLNQADATISIEGTPAEIELGEWVFRQLDQPIDSPTVPQFRIPGGKDEVVEVIRLSLANNPQYIQEMLTILRTVADIQKIFNYTPVAAIALRGKSGEVAMSEWLVHQLEQEPPTADSGVHQFTAQGKPDDIVRVVYMIHNKTPKATQEALTAARMQGHIMKAFNLSNAHAIIIRGTAPQLDQAERLIAQVDRPAPQ
jgi:type II secretory pathway component GspD/PulD (secretin)